MNKPKVLALLTNRKSNNNQVTTLANLLSGGDSFTKKILFNWSIKIPNRIAKFILPVWMTIKKSDSFFDIDDCDIIVTAGRQSIRYAIHLKKTMYKNAKIIQIMNPDMDSKHINLVMLPSHDKKHIETYKNKVITYHGSIFDKFRKESEENIENFKNLTRNCKKPYISVFVGGSSKNCKFTKELSEEFVETILKISTNMNASLLITTSRRTDKFIIKNIKNKIDLTKNYLYEFNAKNEFNPFLSMVELGDYFIVTADSISMINELMTIKPLYIFTKGINAKKYISFCKSAIEIGGAKVLNEDTKILEDFSTKSLNDLEKLKATVLNFLKLN